MRGQDASCRRGRRAVILRKGPAPTRQPPPSVRNAPTRLRPEIGARARRKLPPGPTRSHPAQGPGTNPTTAALRPKRTYPAKAGNRCEGKTQAAAGADAQSSCARARHQPGNRHPPSETHLPRLRPEIGARARRKLPPGPTRSPPTRGSGTNPATAALRPKRTYPG